MEIYVPPKAASFIPVIDLGDDDPNKAARERIAAQIHRACGETGFFYVSNHGIDRRLLDNQLAFTRRFFDLPLEEKLSLHMRRSPTAAG
jgi:isopenicillin N synthase-like dioxygenase